MLGSRRTYKVILMIDIVKAWFTTCCRMCTLSADDMYNYERLRQRRKSIEAKKKNCRIVKKDKKETNMEINKEGK